MKFKVGDRVSGEAMYPAPGVGILYVKGTFEGIDANGFAKIKAPGKEPYLVVPKSLRKLVKKERRRVWVNYYEGGAYCWAHISKQLADTFSNKRIECVEFVEVRKNK